MFRSGCKPIANPVHSWEILAPSLEKALSQLEGASDGARLASAHVSQPAIEVATRELLLLGEGGAAGRLWLGRDGPRAA
jgi:hypothetical protein